MLLEVLLRPHVPLEGDHGHEAHPVALEAGLEAAVRVKASGPPVPLDERCLLVWFLKTSWKTS